MKPCYFEMLDVKFEYMSRRETLTSAALAISCELVSASAAALEVNRGKLDTFMLTATIIHCTG